MFVPALIAVAVVEVLAFVEVGRTVGWPLAVVLLLGISVVGTRLLRVQRRLAIERVSLAVAERRASARATIDGALGFLGAVLLVVPGFVTDILGGLLLFPATRSLASRWISRRYADPMIRFAAAVERFGPRRQAPRRQGPCPADVESTAVDYEPDRLDR